MSTFTEAASPAESAMNREELERRVAELGQWFHNLDLHGVRTAPNHFLGDFPSVKWRHISKAIPADVSGATVLDIGCNAGFYSIEMKKRGAAKVVAMDVDDRYLNQGRFAAETLGFEIDFRKLSVYEVDTVPGQFDFVFFLGVFYHLRYPLLALDKVVKKVGGKLFFQTMIRGSEDVKTWEKNYHFWNKEIFADPTFPCMYFVEQRYADDPTNWFIPNRAAAEASLRSAGLEIVEHPEPETWVCLPGPESTRDGRYVVDMELDGTL